MTLVSINWNPPIGINLNYITIRYYSLMFVIAFTLGLYLMKKIFINEKISLEKLDSLFMYTVIATLVGARLGHVFFYDWAYFKNNLLEIFLPVRFSPHFEIIGYRGLASHGAAIGIIVALYYYSKKVLKKPLLFILDRVGIIVALAGFFIRIGNLMNSEIIGKPTHSNFGIVFVQLNENFPRYPTQIFESLSYLAIFFILWRIYWKTDKKNQQGYLFGLFFVLTWSVRFLIEFLKEPQEAQRATWLLNTGQLLSIPLIILGIYYMSRKNKKAI